MGDVSRHLNCQCACACGGDSGGVGCATPRQCCGGSAHQRQRDVPRHKAGHRFTEGDGHRKHPVLHTRWHANTDRGARRVCRDIYSNCLLCCSGVWVACGILGNIRNDVEHKVACARWQDSRCVGCVPVLPSPVGNRCIYCASSSKSQLVLYKTVHRLAEGDSHIKFTCLLSRWHFYSYRGFCDVYLNGLGCCRLVWVACGIRCDVSRHLDCQCACACGGDSGGVGCATPRQCCGGSDTRQRDVPRHKAGHRFTKGDGHRKHPVLHTRWHANTDRGLCRIYLYSMRLGGSVVVS